MKSDHKIHELESVFAEKQLFHLPQACIPARTYPPCLENTRPHLPAVLGNSTPHRPILFLVFLSIHGDPDRRLGAHVWRRQVIDNLPKHASPGSISPISYFSPQSDVG